MEFPLKNFPEAVIFLDKNDQIAGINLAGEQLLDSMRADLLGKSVDLILPRYSPTPDGEADGHLPVGLRRSDGQTDYVGLSISNIHDLSGNQLGRVLMVREGDLAHAQPEEFLQTQNHILQALQETTFDLHSSLDLDIVLCHIVERACDLLGTEHGYLDILRETGEMEPVVGIGVLKESLKFKVDMGEGVSGMVWKTGKPLVVSNYDRWAGRIVGFTRGLIGAIVGIPVLLNEQVVGVIGVARDYGSENSFTKEDVSVLMRFADLAVLALQNARLFEQAQAEIEFRRKTEIELRNANQLLQLQIERVELLQEQLQELAVRDTLTNLFNRRYLHEMLEVEFARSTRAERSLAILMIDSDHLKGVNDRYGHKAGDDFLVHVANVIRENIRAGDIACRYGGDEFVVVMSNVSEEIAIGRAEELRKNVDSHRIPGLEEIVEFSISIGIAMFPQHGSSGDALLQKADQALYVAKRQGKNCVILYSDNR